MHFRFYVINHKNASLIDLPLLVAPLGRFIFGDVETEAVFVCDNGKMLHDAPVSIRKRTPEDLSNTKSRGLLNAASLLHSPLP